MTSKPKYLIKTILSLILIALFINAINNIRIWHMDNISYIFTSCLFLGSLRIIILADI